MSTLDGRLSHFAAGVLMGIGLVLLWVAARTIKWLR